MVLVSVFETAPGWVELRFRYEQAVVNFVKQIPGCTWDKEKRVWRAPASVVPILQKSLESLAKFTVGAKLHMSQPPALYEGLIGKCRPYQVEGAKRLIENTGYILAFSPRVGKTRTASLAGASLLANGAAKTLLFMYPNTVKGEWQSQFKDQTGLDIYTMEGLTALEPAEFERIARLPHLALGVHYELIRQNDGEDSERVKELVRLLEIRGGKFAVIADEVHYLKNRKAGRTKIALALSRHPQCGWRWGLTGTPMRNYPRDMWAMFDFIQPGSMGSYGKFTVRHCGGRQGEYGWVDDGVTNHEELAERLGAVSYRLTRQDVAGWLPASDRQVVLCNMSGTEMKKYQKQEAAIGALAVQAMSEKNSPAALNALKQLSRLTTATKLSTLLDRIDEHTQNRQVKILVFAHHHETLETAWDAFEAETKYAAQPKAHPRFSVPGFFAGGRLLPDKRKKSIEQWKACAGPAALFANIISSGVGIDLADADTAVFLELSWVPADFLQAESRLADVHLGKRTTPPLLEYLLTKATIDEDMGLKLLNKIQAIEKVVGGDGETKGLSGTLGESGLVDRNLLSLSSEDESVVASVIDGLRAKLFGDDSPDADLVTDDSDNNREDTDDDEPEEETADE